MKIVKWLLHAIAILSCVIPGIVNANIHPGPDPSIASCTTIEIFSRKGCPHCARAYEFLDRLQQQYPSLVIHSRDIDSDPENRNTFFKLNQKFGIQTPGVPSFLICDNFLAGYTDAKTSGGEITGLLGVGSISNHEPAADEIVTWLFGKVSVAKLGLPVFTIVIGLIDGFNPCAMWVLLILLSLLVNLRSRRRIILIAGTFVLISGVVYFAFMSAWLNLFLIIGYSRLIQIIAGTLAVLIGMVHIKDYFVASRGLSLSIPESARPSIYMHIRRVIYAENTFAALISVTIFAILVNFLELLCTAGLPALYTQILSGYGLQPLQHYGYLLLYNLAYIFDDTLMMVMAVYTLGSPKLQQEQGRWLKLLSGWIIFLLGGLLIFAPELLV